VRLGQWIFFEYRPVAACVVQASVYISSICNDREVSLPLGNFTATGRFRRYWDSRHHQLLSGLGTLKINYR
jgi:hypothetical protein